MIFNLKFGYNSDDSTSICIQEFRKLQNQSVELRKNLEEGWGDFSF